MPDSTDTTEQKVKLTPAELLERHRYKGKLTPMFRERAIAMVKGGSPPRTALRALGCSERTIYQWEEDAKATENVSRFGIFRRELQGAEQECISRVSAHATKLTEKDGRVALDYLGRRDPDHWGKKDTLDVNVEVSADGILRAIADAQQKVLTGSYRFLPEGQDEPE